MKIFQVRCDQCGAEEKRVKDGPEPMLHVIAPMPGEARHYDFCDFVCLAQFGAEKAIEG